MNFRAAFVAIAALTTLTSCQESDAPATDTPSSLGMGSGQDLRVSLVMDEFPSRKQRGSATFNPSESILLIKTDGFPLNDCSTARASLNKGSLEVTIADDPEVPCSDVGLNGRVLIRGLVMAPETVRLVSDEGAKIASLSVDVAEGG